MKKPLVLLGAMVGAVSLHAAPPKVIADFEQPNYAGWTVEGKAFGTAPAAGKIGGQMVVNGFQGKGLANSFHGGDGTRGKLTSQPFTVDRKYLTFLIGGGGFAGETCLNLVVDGKVLRTATGPNLVPGGTEELEPQYWEVSDIHGKQAVLEIVDQRGSAWGHINVDHIALADEPGKAELAKPAQPPGAERTRGVTITGNFLQLPLLRGANKERPGDKLTIEADGKVLRYMHVKLAAPGQQPDFWYSADLREFKGREVTLRIKSHEAAVLEQLKFSDEEKRDPKAYAGPYRPQFHFSPRLGWMNDINGAYYHEGLYHIFYQYNPAATETGAGFDMHWAHSVSKDLVHWEEWPVALFPDATGNCFSGTAVVTPGPIPGLVKTAAPVLCFAATSPFSQHLATTPDGGRTWQRFAGNPVIPNIGQGDRDPKIFWHEESGHYGMVLYIGHQQEPKDEYRLFRSKDLIKWEETSSLPNWFECPEFIPMKSAVTGEKVWLLYGCYRDAETKMRSAYQVGRYDGKTFTATGQLREAHAGPNFYAALTFNGQPDGRHIIMGWANSTKFPGEPFNQCASAPLEMSLRAINGQDTLCFYPAREVEALRGAPLVEAKKASAAELAPKLQALTKDAALDVVLRFKPNGKDAVRVTIRGIGFTYDPATRKLTRSNGGKVAGSLELHPGESVEARFLIDRGLVECFWNSGEGAYAVASLHTDGGPAFAVEGGTVEALTVYPMQNIWGAMATAK